MYVGVVFTRFECSVSYVMFPLSQVPQCHSDHVPSHTALLDYRRHHQQGRSEAAAGSQGPGEGHPAGGGPAICTRLPTP